MIVILLKNYTYIWIQYTKLIDGSFHTFKKELLYIIKYKCIHLNIFRDFTYFICDIIVCNITYKTWM